MSRRLEDRLRLATERIYIAGYLLHKGQTPESEIDVRLDNLEADVVEVRELRAKLAKRDALRAELSAASRTRVQS